MKMKLISKDLPETTKDSIVGRNSVRRRRLIQRNTPQLKDDIHRQKPFPTKSAQVLTFTNVKSGVGKTSMTLLMAEALTQLYKKTRVLLVDMDPDKHLTAILAPKISPEAPSSYDVLKAVCDPKEAIYKTWIPNVDIIPGDLRMQDLDTEEFKKNKSATQKVKQRMSSLTQLKNYKFIMYDTPPAATLMTSLALETSHYYVPVVNLDQHLIKSLQATEIMVAYVAASANQNLKRLGILVNMYNLKARRHTSKFMDYLEQDWPEGTLITPLIPKTVGIERSNIDNGTVLMIPQQRNFRSVRAIVLSVARELGERMLKYSKGSGGDIVNEEFLYKEYWG